ncbi:helix-turn-helix domain-containing protein [Hoyosella sp. G463]|uniref:Helix-turn-helix domain-containing protein n=1 Tax=Lolliginicoccus lacisalsi TaxID=2742202 RepID=A0A927JDZ0_9ACTN|nr:helix-turn-helix domain-containing protein [Lolliginicoccus lacisalsi]MBD8506882.1 helix-turn-helix domain-containing protein [Lolliginicoccus lacisalsi]
MAEDQLADWISRLTSDVLRPAALDAMVERVNNDILAALPELREDDELRRDLDASTRGQVRAFIAAIANEQAEYQPPPAAVALARTVARRGMDVKVLLRVYGTGRTTAINILTEIVQSVPVDAETKMRALVSFWESAITWLELSTDVLLAAYTSERATLERGATARRADTIHALLEGATIPIDTASTRLAYPLRPWHTALILWSDTDDTEALGHREQVIRHAARALDSRGRFLSLPSGARGHWAWIATDQPASTDAIASISLPAGTRIAVGSAARGSAGFRQSHRDAVAAQQIASVSTNARACTLYRQVEIPYLLGRDADALREFLARTLGPLAEPTEHAARLRDTVAAYIRSGGSPTDAARTLQVHKNTVRYRIEQAFTELGAAHDGDHADLGLALRCIDTLGIGWLHGKS